MHHSVTMTGDSVESHVSSSVLLVETPVERFSETESSVNDKRTRVIAERTKHDAADSVKVKHNKTQLYTVWRIQFKIQLPKSLVPKLMPKVLGELATRA